MHISCLYHIRSIDKMTKSFEEWFVQIYQKDNDNRLYHEWLFDQMFSQGELTSDIRKKVMILIHESLLEGMHSGNIINIHYCKELTKLVKVPAGMYKGQRISELTNTDEIWTLCLQIKRVAKNYILRQACTAKLNEIQVQREFKREEMKKKNRGKR